MPYHTTEPPREETEYEATEREAAIKLRVEDELFSDEFMLLNLLSETEHGDNVDKVVQDAFINYYYKKQMLNHEKNQMYIKIGKEIVKWLDRQVGKRISYEMEKV